MLVWVQVPSSAFYLVLFWTCQADGRPGFREGVGWIPCLYSTVAEYEKIRDGHRNCLVILFFIFSFFIFLRQLPVHGVKDSGSGQLG